MATSEATKALAVAEVWKGRSSREVATQFGVTHVTVTRWAKEAGPPPAVAPPATPPPAEGPPAAAMTLERMLRVVQEQLEEAIAICREAKRVGHYDASAKAMRQITSILPVLLRCLDKVGDDKDTIKIPRVDFEAAVARNLERFKALTAHEPRCFDCGRKMRADLAGLAKDAQARLFDHAENTHDTK